METFFPWEQGNDPLQLYMTQAFAHSQAMSLRKHALNLSGALISEHKEDKR
jgi:hypothetical protein